MICYTFNIMIPNFIKTIKQILWRRISQSEIRNSAVAEKSESESEGGQKFLPPNPLPFCPPERSVSAALRAAISRNFVQKRFELRSAITIKNNKRYGLRVSVHSVQCFQHEQVSGSAHAVRRWADDSQHSEILFTQCLFFDTIVIYYNEVKQQINNSQSPRLPAFGGACRLAPFMPVRHIYGVAELFK